ncbi:hypothetical protein JCM10450v2_005728 [Rhodotorula kratochvilovae]
MPRPSLPLRALLVAVLVLAALARASADVPDLLLDDASRPAPHAALAPAHALSQPADAHSAAATKAAGQQPLPFRILRGPRRRRAESVNRAPFASRTAEVAATAATNPDVPSTTQTLPRASGVVSTGLLTPSSAGARAAAAASASPAAAAEQEEGEGEESAAGGTVTQYETAQGVLVTSTAAAESSASGTTDAAASSQTRPATGVVDSAAPRGDARWAGAVLVAVVVGAALR